jgi:hypothetical protein
MRIFHTLLYLFCFALVVGCTQQSITPHRESTALLLDNHGGYSHAGRRIALLLDGSYTDTTYTDVVGDEHAKTGRYTLNAERTLLTLTPTHGEMQHLYRIDYGGQQYWVRDGERERITQSGEAQLRQISLTVVP